MGQQIVINPDYTGVRFDGPPGIYDAGDTVTLTDAEYAVVSADTTLDRLYTVGGSVADPVREDPYDSDLVALSNLNTQPYGRSLLELTGAAALRATAAEIQVTHPNTYDVLVQIWDEGNSRLQVVYYDSGWRDISASQGANIASGASRIRRVNSTVHLRVKWTLGGSYTGNDADTEGLIIAAGFQPDSGYLSEYFNNTRNGSTGSYFWWLFSNSGARLRPYGPVAGNALGQAVFAYPTNDAIPSSLPGTLISAAPYA